VMCFQWSQVRSTSILMTPWILKLFISFISVIVTSKLTLLLYQRRQAPYP
jgi:hypothetical protein